MSLTDGLLAFWKLDDNGSGGLSLVDSSGSGHTLSNSGVTLCDGKIGGAAYINGGPNNLTTDAGIISAADFSVSMWIRREGEPWDGTDYFQLWTESEIEPVFHLSNPASFLTSTGVWRHLLVSCVYGTSLKTYIDGSLVSTDASPSFAAVVTHLTLGNHGWATSDTIGLKIDDVGVWGRALSSSDAYNLYNGGSGNTYPFSSTPPPSPQLDLSNSGVTFLF